MFNNIFKTAVLVTNHVNNNFIFSIQFECRLDYYFKIIYLLLSKTKEFNRHEIINYIDILINDKSNYQCQSNIVYIIILGIVLQHTQVP